MIENVIKEEDFFVKNVENSERGTTEEKWH